MDEQIKRYAMPFFPNGTLAEPQEVERGSWMQYADYARDIKALRKRERYWRHFTWLYRERLMCEESTTTEQAATIERLQDALMHCRLTAQGRRLKGESFECRLARIEKDATDVLEKVSQAVDIIKTIRRPAAEAYGIASKEAPSVASVVLRHINEN